MTNTYWDEYEKTSEQESGGGGILARVQIDTGYKVYVAGFDQSETFFPAPASDKAAREIAKSKAAVLGRVQWGIQIMALRDGALSRGQAVTWQGDRYFNTDSWTSASEEVVVPSLQEAGIDELPFVGYARIGFKNDPFKEAQGEEGKTDEDQAGNARFPQVAYISAVLNEMEYQAALAAADSLPAQAGGDAKADVLAAFDGLAVPPLFGDDHGTWESTVREIALKAGGGPDPVRLVKITNALTGGHPDYIGYSAEDIGGTDGADALPQLVLDWANSLGI